MVSSAAEVVLLGVEPPSDELVKGPLILELKVDGSLVDPSIVDASIVDASIVDASLVDP